jgi:hypothetical protein
LQDGDKALDRQRRMPESEDSAFRPMRFLRRKMFAHGDTVGILVRLAPRQQGFRLVPEAKHEFTGGLSPRQRRRLACPGLHAMNIA